MKNKILRILLAAFVAAAVVLALTACATNEQSLDGMYIVTFQFNGGILDTGATNVSDRIYHGYKPNDPLIDINEKFTFRRTGYDFVGWYKDEALTDPWNKATDRVTGNMTLYAKWETQIKFTYTVFLVADGQTQSLGSYTVEKDAKFDDRRNYGTALSIYNKTFLGYYSDQELNTPWDEDYTHPGGETSLDIPVYVKAMEGVWTFVSNYEELTKAIGSNIWLTDNIDCGGAELYFGNNTREFANSINGNCKTISNFVIPQKGNVRLPEYSLFGRITATASITDVYFVNAQMDINPSSPVYAELKVAALAVSAEEGCKISNVTISGTYTNSSTADITDEKVNRPFYENSTVVPDSFNAGFVKKDS